ncbi:MAG: LON peptidase substrate-binding domain-containing protein [Fimbriimonadaceae bacterium]|nr:LON peptidase substrate-binding domain-containing protein [Fimbriimonadaceae bacterium]
MADEALPLFALQEVVLYPGMPLPLHIFEPRYVRMITACRDGDRQFGVVLLRSGQEIGGPAEPWDVGTVAEIVECREVEAGRLVLLAVGRRRFRIARWWRQDDILRALVVPFEDSPAAVDSGLVDEVRRLAAEHLRLVARAVGKEIDPPLLPDEAQQLSFVLAAGLQAPLLQRQDLLELTDTSVRLQRLRAVLRQQIAMLSHRLAIGEQAEHITGTNGHLDHRHLTQAMLDRLGEQTD